MQRARGPGSSCRSRRGYRLRGLDALVDSAADHLAGRVVEPAFYLVDPGRSGRREVQAEPGWRASHCWMAGVLCLARLSQTRCTSSPAGTFLSILARNFLTSAARWRRCRELITVPPAMLNAANRSNLCQIRPTSRPHQMQLDEQQIEAERATPARPTGMAATLRAAHSRSVSSAST